MMLNLLALIHLVHGTETEQVNAVEVAGCIFSRRGELLMASDLRAGVEVLHGWLVLQSKFTAHL